MIFMLGLPRSSRNKDSVMVVVDHFPEIFVPCRKIPDATNIVDLYIKEIVILHDIPKQITLNEIPSL